MRAIKEIYADWKKGCVPDDLEVAHMHQQMEIAAETARDMNAGEAVELFYINLSYSFMTSLWSRKRNDLIEIAAEAKRKRLSLVEEKTAS